MNKLMKAFQTALVHDLDADGFADMYAQTIAYGLLSARISDPHKKDGQRLRKSHAHKPISPRLDGNVPQGRRAPQRAGR